MTPRDRGRYQPGQEAHQAEPHEGHHRRYRGKDHAYPPIQRGYFNAATGKADRVGIKVNADGTRVRVFKSNGEEIAA
jgi:hypothetical protein